MSFLQQLAGLSSRDEYFGTVGWSVGNGGWGAVGAALAFAPYHGRYGGTAHRRRTDKHPW